MFRTPLAVLVAAASVFAGHAYSQDAIKIGVTQPLTGAFAASGNYVTEGAKLAEAAINAAGGVLGRKIQLVIEDNKSNPTEAVATAEKLIAKDKVPVMMGAWSSTLTLAVMPKLMEYGVPMLVETSSSGKITVSGNPWIFRISPTSEMEARAFTGYVKTLGIKKADFLATNNDFGLGASKEFAEMLKSSGAQVGVVETMDPKATDFSAQLAKIKASGGDTLFAHEWNDRLLQHLGCHRSDLLVADGSLLVDHVGFRHAVDTVVDTDLAIRVHHRHGVRIAELVEPAQGVVTLVLVVEPVDRHHAGLRQLDHQRMLLPARHAPRRPHIEQPYLAFQVRHRQLPRGFMQLHQRERRGGLVDQR